MVNFTYSALVAVLHERLFRNALQLRLHKQKLKIYLTTFGAAQKQPLRGTFSMPSQELQGLAVELVPVEVLELAVGARRIEYPECAPAVSGASSFGSVAIRSLHYFAASATVARRIDTSFASAPLRATKAIWANAASGRAGTITSYGVQSSDA